nr:MAG TPA: hypothetical protein [Caudoviricetes sp.]
MPWLRRARNGRNGVEAWLAMVIPVVARPVGIWF